MKEKSDLEIEADKLLGSVLKNKKKNKTKTEEYPILSDFQLRRRRAKEIPFSSLSMRQKAKAESGPEDLDD